MTPLWLSRATPLLGVGLLLGVGALWLQNHHLRGEKEVLKSDLRSVRGERESLLLALDTQSKEIERWRDLTRKAEARVEAAQKESTRRYKALREERLKQGGERECQTTMQALQSAVDLYYQKSH